MSFGSIQADRHHRTRRHRLPIELKDLVADAACPAFLRGHPLLQLNNLRDVSFFWCPSAYPICSGSAHWLTGTTFLFQRSDRRDQLSPSSGSPGLRMPDFRIDVFPSGILLAVDSREAIALLDTGLGRRRVLHHPADSGLVEEHRDARSAP